MLLTLFLPALESIINRALNADPDALAKIASLQDEVIEIHCDDWNMHFYITPYAKGLLFSQKSPGKATVIVRGTLNNFLHIFIKGASTATLFQHPIDIEGNTHTIEVMRDAFKYIDIDFEERLSHFLGDSIAHKLCMHLKNTKKIAEKSVEKMMLQTKEYIHYETNSLISHKQAEQFYIDIATLRNDVERIEARIEKW